MDNLKITDIQTADEVAARIIANIKKLGDESVIEGSFKRDIISATSEEFKNAYFELALLKHASFANTSWGDYLTLACKDYGVDRKLAQKAEGMVQVKGTPRAYIPQNSLFQTDSGLKFYTAEEGDLDEDGQATLRVIAGDVGTAYNVKAETITNIPMNISGVQSVTNEEEIRGGYDEETDEALLSRYNDKIRLPATSGNSYHYKQWALSVDGVGGVKVVPLEKGAGTVGLYIVDNNGEKAPEKLIENVKNYIEKVKPIGADVYVQTPDTMDINITVVSPKDFDVDKFKKLIQKYFATNGFNLDRVSEAMVTKKVFESGASDYDKILINGKNDNVDLHGKLPRLAGVKVE